MRRIGWNDEWMRYVDTATGGQDSTLAAWLTPRLDTANVVGIRTGFVSLPAVMAFLDRLIALLDRGGELDVVLGGDGDQADPQALQQLLRLARNERTSLRVVTDPQVFHNAKTYFVRYPDQRAEAWVGSANLTQAGLMHNHEAAVSLDSDVDDPKILDEVLAGIRFYRDGHGSVPLDADVIRLIQARRTAATASRRAPALHTTEMLGDLLLPTMEDIDAVASAGGRGLVVGRMPTGFTDLDVVLAGGLHPGTLTVIASRPAVGRTTLLLDFVRSGALRNRCCTALFEFELPASQVMQRILSAEARIRLGDIRAGWMTDDDWTRIARLTDEVSDAPLLLNTTPRPDLEALVTEIAEVCADHEVRLVAIDPLSLIRVPLEAGAGREREISVAIRRLKTLALELDVPIVVTAELNRGPEHRTDKRPQLVDLRDSDAVAQVADAVILIHRPDAFERDDPRMGEADLILAKHRAGPTTTVTVAHQLHYCRFVDMARE